MTADAVPGGDAGEQHAHELADKIRMLAATDPGLAQDLVDQLVDALDRATGGSFRAHLCATAGGAPAGPLTMTDLGRLAGATARNS